MSQKPCFPLKAGEICSVKSDETSLQKRKKTGYSHHPETVCWNKFIGMCGTESWLKSRMSFLYCELTAPKNAVSVNTKGNVNRKKQWVKFCCVTYARGKMMSQVRD